MQNDHTSKLRSFQLYTMNIIIAILESFPKREFFTYITMLSGQRAKQGTTTTTAPLRFVMTTQPKLVEYKTSTTWNQGCQVHDTHSIATVDEHNERIARLVV